MLTQERYEKILALLSEKKSVTVSELAEMLSVSTETIRRDLVFLESKGHLKRVFGGAVKGGGLSRFSDYSARMIENLDKKTELCQTAVELIEEGDILAVDDGSTATVFADILCSNFSKLTIITASLAVFEKTKDKFNVILTGGEYQKDERVFYGDLAVQTLGNLHANKCFIFPSGITLEHGIEDYISLFNPLRKKIMEISDRVMILADSTKYGRRAFVKLADASPEFVYVTDSALSSAIYEKYSENLYILKKE